MCWVWYHRTQFVYECQYEALAKFLAEETRGWYYGEHGETLTLAQYDWAYNEATEGVSSNR